MATSAGDLTSTPTVLSSDFLQPGGQDPSLGLIILNRPLPRITAHLWQRASLRVCADGGANRLHDELPPLVPSRPADQVRETFLPDVIVGDLDSIRPYVAEYYRRRGVELVDLSPDQMTSDLPKSIKCLDALRQRRGLPDDFTMIALGGLGGRLDHTLANLSALHAHRDVRLVLCGDGNITRLVPRGSAVIRPSRPVEGPCCGLVPLQGPAVATTSGLRWNLDNTPMAVGALVSTSNIMDSDVIPVQTDTDLVWTVEYDDDLYAPVAD